MNDIFKEQIVKRKPTARDALIRVLLLLAVVVVIMFALIMGWGTMVFMIGAAAGFGAFMLMSFLNVEYEYIFTNGDLDIDVIYNRSRRKRLFSAHVNEFEVMAHVEDKNRAGEFSGAQDTRDYSSGVVGSNTYAFLTTYEGKHTKIIIEPNEMMLKAISTVLTRRKLHIKPQ